MAWEKNAVTVAWLGHATALICFYGVWILTDPVLFPRVGLDLKIGSLGPKRFVGAALPPEQVPVPDLVLLSHAHMDHMDLPSLRLLKNAPHFIAAKNTADVFREQVNGQIREIAWGESVQLTLPAGDLRIRGFEVLHWGARWKHDKHRSYNGYLIEREGRRLLFGGDTAFTESFAQLKREGPIDLAMMPIGAYNPWIWVHCNPEQAVAMATMAGARHIMPIHHQAFKLSREPMGEPIERFCAALDKEPDRIALRRVGETFQIPPG